MGPQGLECYCIRVQQSQDMLADLVRRRRLEGGPVTCSSYGEICELIHINTKQAAIALSECRHGPGVCDPKPLSLMRIDCVSGACS
jgi:hypothetical protein